MIVYRFFFLTYNIVDYIHFPCNCTKPKYCKENLAKRFLRFHEVFFFSDESLIKQKITMTMKTLILDCLLSLSSYLSC